MKENVSRSSVIEFIGLMLLIFAYAGDAAPMVNEAHYLVKAKNFWDPAWCANDLFAASGKAHTTYYATFGSLTQFFCLATTAWIGRIVGWAGLAFGLMQVCRSLTMHRFASWIVLILWIVGIEQGNLAGEWVFGGTEAKVPAYGLFLLGVTELIRRRWNRVWIFFGAASAFHVLVGGWSVLAAMLTWVLTERVFFQNADSGSKRQPLFTSGLFVGGALSLIGLLPALWLTSQASPAETIEAARTYVFVRLPHHLLPSSFPTQWYQRHGVLIALTIGLSVWQRRNRGENRLREEHVRVAWTRMELFVTGTVLIAVLGILIDCSDLFDRDTVARVLRYYWFRMTDVTVPLLLGCLVAQELGPVFHPGNETRMARMRRSFAGLVLLASFGQYVVSTMHRVSLGVPPSHSNRLLGWDADAPPERQQKVFSDWLKVCDYLRNCMPEEEIFLTPRHQQTFKWYANRAEVVNFKDVPQDAKSLKEWSMRFRDVYPQRLGTMRVTIQYAKLREYRRLYGVRFMVVDRRIAGQNLPLIRIYPLDPENNDSYAVYELPPPD